jgi:hypothetical protein
LEVDALQLESPAPDKVFREDRPLTESDERAPEPVGFAEEFP